MGNLWVAHKDSPLPQSSWRKQNLSQKPSSDSRDSLWASPTPWQKPGELNLVWVSFRVTAPDRSRGQWPCHATTAWDTLEIYRKYKVAMMEALTGDKTLRTQRRLWHTTNSLQVYVKPIFENGSDQYTLSWKKKKGNCMQNYPHTFLREGTGLSEVQFLWMSVWLQRPSSCLTNPRLGEGLPNAGPGTTGQDLMAGALYRLYAQGLGKVW